jgi:phage shock protein C
MGVCKGLAQHFGWSLFWTRFATVAGALILGVWPVVIVYLVAGFMMKPEPVVPFSNEMDQEFYTSYTASRHTALARVKKTYDNLERRLRRLEDSVTAREFDWDRRFNEGS